MAIKRDKYDAVFSELVRERAGNQCEVCGVTDATNQIECAHIYGRRNVAVRWDGMNAVSLCHSHHRHFTENPLEFRLWLLNEYGEGHLDILREKANRVRKWKEWEKGEMYAHYRAELKRLRAERMAGNVGRIEFTSYE